MYADSAAAAQTTKQQVSRRPFTFAGRPEDSAEDFLNELTAYLIDKKVAKEDWPYILVEQLREAAAAYAQQYQGLKLTYSQLSDRLKFRRRGK